MYSARTNLFYIKQITEYSIKNIYNQNLKIYISILLKTCRLLTDSFELKEYCLTAIYFNSTRKNIYLASDCVNSHLKSKDSMTRS